MEGKDHANKTGGMNGHRTKENRRPSARKHARDNQSSNDDRCQVSDNDAKRAHVPKWWSEKKR